MKIEDMPAAILRRHAERREETELRMFTAGHDFYEIKDVLEMMDRQVARIANAVRDTIPTLRDLPFDEAVERMQRAIDAAADDDETTLH